MDNELFELCREVYEKTGFNDTAKWLCLLNDHSDTPNYEVEDSPIVADYITNGNIPLYNSDYLLEKLPNKVMYDTVYGYLTLNFDDCPAVLWTAQYENGGSEEPYSGESDTPLKSLLKLTLALHSAGQLNTEGE